MQSQTGPPTTALSPRKKARTFCNQDVSVLDEKENERRGPPVLVWRCGNRAACCLACTSGWVTSRCMTQPGEWTAGHSSNLEDLSGAPVTLG